MGGSRRLRGDWLTATGQSGGASATLRRLVETARKQGANEERAQQAAEAIHRFMWDMAGNLAGLEDASRSFYRRDWRGFEERIAAWPKDVRTHLQHLIQKLQRLKAAD